MRKERSLEIYLCFALITLLVSSLSTFARAELPKELPEKVRFVGLFDYQKSRDKALLAAVQQVLLFAAEADHVLLPLADSLRTADASGIERVTVVQVSGQEAALPLASVRFQDSDSRSALVATLKKRGEASRSSDSGNPTIQYLSRGETMLILGEAEGLQTLDDTLLAQVHETATSQSTDRSHTAWIWMSPDWFQASARPELADKSWSIAGALSNVRGAELELQEGSDPELSWDIYAASRADAALLLDDLQNSIAAAQSGDGQRLIVEMLQTALVRRQENMVSLHLTPEIAALELLAESQAARGLLTWRTGAAGRESDDRLAELFQVMDLSPGDAVADIGAGRGFLAVRLASVVGDNGRVYAVEISEESLEHLSSRRSASGLEQIRIVEGKVDDPRLPEESLDTVVIINAYHEMSEYASMLRNIKESLKTGGRVVILDSYSKNRQSESRKVQVEEHEISPELVQQDLQSAGFEIILRDDQFIDHDHGDHRHLNALVVARKPN